MSLASEVGSTLLELGVDEEVAVVALAALHGEEALDAVLAGESPTLPSEAESMHSKPAHVYLREIQVEGFRGIGPSAKLELEPGPGLTVVAGRNGSGKSSFAEALEVLLTGDSWRWKSRPVEWKQGWRNLHQASKAMVQAEFVVEGQRGYARVWREWDADVRDVSAGQTQVQLPGEKVSDLDAVGWAMAIDLYRPILSYSELGAIADTPSTLFDALSGVLGVDELVAAADLLRRRRLDMQATLKEAKRALKDELIPALEGSDDVRAAQYLEWLSRKPWDLDSASGALGDAIEADEDLALLRQIEAVAVPDEAEALQAAEHVANSTTQLKLLEGGQAGQADRIASLLKLALAEHADHGDRNCPVCGAGQLDQAWRASAEEELQRLEGEAAAFRRAETDLREAVAAARSAATILLPAGVGVLGGPGKQAMAAVSKLTNWPEDPTDLVGHIREFFSPAVSAVSEAIATAREAIREREDLWRPIATRLAAWIDEARQALADDDAAARFGAAEKALGEATTVIRARRFEPISTQAIALWNELRLQSNVRLDEVSLVGRGNKRRVDLKVTVDGVEGAALGVVSQGEVNCLALSLFFPRVMLPESNFGFIVIDDPVQAMDPARVDGLARVFSKVAESIQLVIFTHDDRLPEALRRLGLPHKVLQVTRRSGSVVEVTPSVDPVIQYFLDARAVARDEDLPIGVANQVVPGFCRSGIEAACIEAIRRRRLAKGEAHSRVEELLVGLKTTELMALALFDDETQGGEVLGEINAKWGKRSGDAYRDAQRGAHKGFSGGLIELINECQSLAERVRLR